MTLNVDEYGENIYVNMGQDISSALSYTIVLQPGVGTTLEKTATLGSTAVTVDGVTYPANQHIVYTVQDGDITKAGKWRKRGKVKLSATQELLSNYQFFTVLD